ncbi:clp protease adaptor protein [Haematococcus lacustris]
MAATLLRNNAAIPRPSKASAVLLRTLPRLSPAVCSCPQGIFLRGTRCAASSKPGGSTLERPTLPGLEHSSETVKKRPPTYKVMLHNDNYNKREYVVKILLKVVEGITVDDAVVTMQEAHQSGVALVIACPQEDAERFCEGLRLNGLTSTIEPGR